MPWLFTLTAKKLLEINEHFTPHAIIGNNEQRTRIVGGIKESQSNPDMIRIETEFGALEFSRKQTLAIEGEPIPYEERISS